MALECDTVLEEIEATSALVSEGFSSLLETFGTMVAAITLSVVIAGTETSNANAASAITSDTAYSFPAETATASDAAVKHIIVAPLSNQARAQSEVFSLDSALIEEDAEADSVVTESVIAFTGESAAASSTVFQHNIVTVLVANTARASSSVPFPAGVTVVEETVDATDTAIPSVIARSLASSSASASSAITSESDSRADLLVSAISASDTVLQNVTSSQFVIEDIEADSAVILGGMKQVWSVATDTMGMTRWNLELSNIVTHKDNWLALQDGNIVGMSWSMTYNSGTDPAIKSKIVSGLTDFNDPTLKHVTYFRAAYATEDTLSVKVSNTGSGNEVGFSYPLEPRTANALVPSRAKLGRGARSRYWRVEISNVDRPFELRDAWFEIDSLTRKL